MNSPGNGVGIPAGIVAEAHQGAIRAAGCVVASAAPKKAAAEGGWEEF
jgi:hypothetical protein